MYMKRHAQCSLKDTFPCRLLVLLPCIFPCRSDSLSALRSGKPGLRRKTALRGSSAKEQNRLQRGFFFKVGVLTSLRQTIPVTLVGCFLPRLLPSSQMIISWAHLSPHISGTSSLWPGSLVHTGKTKTIRKAFLKDATTTPVPTYPPCLLGTPSVLTGANRNTVFLVWQQTPWKVYIHSWFVSLPLFFFWTHSSQIF